jgi:hypothetical protein
MIATVGVLAALDRWPYSYYMLLRLVLCGVSLFLLSVRVRLDDWHRRALIGSAILYNLVLPVRLDRSEFCERDPILGHRLSRTARVMTEHTCTEKH